MTMQMPSGLGALIALVVLILSLLVVLGIWDAPRLLAVLILALAVARLT